VAILGTAKGFLKIQISGNFIGYIEEKYIKPLEAELAQSPSQAAIVPAVAEKPFPSQAESNKEYIPSEEAIKSNKPTRNPEWERPILPSGWQVGFETSYIQYREPSVMKERGIMIGYFAGHDFHTKNRFMFKLETRFNVGKMSYSSPDSGAMSGIRDFALESRFLFGTDVRISKDTYITPYSGLGHRFLRDNMRGLQTDLGAYGYLRKSNYLYSPIGVSGTTRLNRNWRFSADGEYDVFLHGWQYSEIGSIVNSNLVIKNDQAKGWGVRASLSIIRAYGKGELSIQPYARYWNVKDSDVFAGMIEPRNNSKEGGIRIGFRF
jgi:hypothetical protein